MCAVLKIKEGSVLGGTLLIAGSCIGAGMLALPIITGAGGFLPAIGMFLVAWLFMTTTGLLLLEANLKLGYQLSLVSLAEKTLGKVGKVLCWILFLFLFYSLSIAYISASGSIVGEISHDVLGLRLSDWIGSLLFTLIFGIVLYSGTRPVDYVNRVLMIGLVLTYFVLIVLGSFYIKGENLKVSQWRYSVAALPVIIISFGFHNMIPSLAHYLKGDRKRLYSVVVLGSAIPLIVYLLWEAVMLGIMGKETTQTFRTVVGRSWINTVTQTFALFAIVTSFLAQSLSLVDFLSDGLKMSSKGRNRGTLVLLTLVPPFIFAFLYPGIFIKALNLAGGFSAVILFGVMPALMVWVLKKRKSMGLRAILLAVLIVGMGIFLLELAQELGVSLIPKDVEAVP